MAFSLLTGAAEGTVCNDEVAQYVMGRGMNNS